MSADGTQTVRTALVHHWLVSMRGGERVLEALSDLFPSADLYTLVCDRANIPAALVRHNIRSSMLQHFPNSKRWSHAVFNLRIWECMIHATQSIRRTATTCCTGCGRSTEFGARSVEHAEINRS